MFSCIYLFVALRAKVDQNLYLLLSPTPQSLPLFFGVPFFGPQRINLDPIEWESTMRGVLCFLLTFRGVQRIEFDFEVERGRCELVRVCL